MLNQINEAVRFIQNHGITQPEVGVILGTGLGSRFVKEMKNTVVINYNSIPHFPISTVESHKGKLIYGEVKGKRVLAMQGRFFDPAPSNMVETLGFLGDFCSGLLFLGAKLLGYHATASASPIADYGTKFLLVAGLLNVLCVLDAYDIAIGKKD